MTQHTDTRGQHTEGEGALPCPICGGNPHGRSEGGGNPRIVCRDCGAHTNTAPTFADAYSLWFRRAIVPGDNRRPEPAPAPLLTEADTLRELGRRVENLEEQPYMPLLQAYYHQIRQVNDLTARIATLEAIGGWGRGTEPESIPTPEEEGEVCDWTRLSEETGDTWETDCDQAYTFTDGGPAENRYIHCPGCGRRIADVTTEAEDDDIPY